MKMILSAVVVTILASGLSAQADYVRSKRDRKLFIHADYIHRPTAANRLNFEKNCAQTEHEVQLNFDRITTATGVRPSELWVKTWTEAYYSHSGGRHPRTHFMGYYCVMELESRAEHLGFVTTGSGRFYSDTGCAADKALNASRASMTFQRMMHSYEKLGFGKEYCFVERIEVLPVYEGRSGD
ncbi:MAG: hypothetical protein HY074_06120 [Deltaproteobacteria bacterium]|nr:hypothetical protein [Deltaproteobacteria bacterium]